MKKICILAAAALLLSQVTFAQVCAFQVDGTKISFNSKEIDIHDVGDIIAGFDSEFQDIFVYVTYDTPLGLANDLKAMIEGSSTSGVVFLNPERSTDFPRFYGPKMVYHTNFIEMELLKKGNIATFTNTNEDPWDFILSGAAPDDYAYNSTRMENYIRTPRNVGDHGAQTEWTNKFDGVVLNLSYQTPMGVLYSFDKYLNQDGLPYMNVVYHTEGTPLCPEKWFTIRDTALQDYDFERVLPGGEVQAIYNGKDIKSFSDTENAYASISALKGKEARPGKGRAVVEFEITPLGTVQNAKILRPSAIAGLDEVIVDFISRKQLWEPQFVGGKPVVVKVSCPIYGEISQW